MNNKNKILASFVVFALALAAIPAVSAATTFGSVVGATDFDTTYKFGPLPGWAFKAFDDDGDTNLDLNDPVYLSHAGAANVQSLDVRISVDGQTPGTQVKGTDGDTGLALTIVLVAKFSDLDSSGGYTAGDALYLDIGPGNVVSPGDVRLTDSGGKTASSRVGASDSDFGTPLLAFLGQATFFDLNGDGQYNRGDIVYFDGPTVGLLYSSVNDIRLMPFNGKTFGSVVGATDFDTTYALPALGGSAFRWFDDDGDGNVDLNDPVYLHIALNQPLADAAGQQVASLDVRIAVDGQTPGTQVKGTDGDTGLPFVNPPPFNPLPLQVRFSDLDSSGGYTAGDALYLDIPGAGPGVVSPGDIRLTDSAGKTASSRVGASDGDFGTPTVNDFNGILPGLGTPTGAYFDLNGDASYNRGDIVYLDGPVGNTFASVNDIRLMPFNGKTFGSVVGGFDFDTTYKLPATPNCAFRWFDDDSDTTLDLNDPVYADVTVGGANVASLDVRISVDGQTPGTQVKGTDGDTGLPFAGAILAIRFSDLDSSGGYTAGDALYLEAPGGSGTIVSPGDVRLTDSGGKTASSRVGASDSDFGTPTLPFGGTCAFFDLNGDTQYNRGDIVYLDGPFVGIGDATVNDVRLMPTSGSAGTGGTGGTTTTSTSATTTSTTTTTTTSTTSATSTSTKAKTPGFELVALVAALGAALVLVRRKL